MCTQFTRLPRSLSLCLAFSLALPLPLAQPDGKARITHTNADWTITIDNNILKCLISAMWACASGSRQPPFSLHKADETHMSYLWLWQQHMCQLICAHIPDASY